LGKAHGVVATDINDDGWMDLFVTNDTEPNYLFINRGNGRFEEVGVPAGVAYSEAGRARSGMGVDSADYDNDGFKDLYISNGYLRDYTNMDFLKYMGDFLKDRQVMRQDLYNLVQQIPSSHVKNYMFKNNGDLTFSNMRMQWGFDSSSNSNGAAYADLDNDGDLDLIINNENGPAFIYKNNARELNKNSYIAFQLKDTGSNTFAIGSKIKVYNGGQIFYRELIPSRGFQSSMDYKQIIGLGKLTQVDSVIITWPNGNSTRFDHPALNKVYNISTCFKTASYYSCHTHL